jgi:hypothetical protein
MLELANATTVFSQSVRSLAVLRSTQLSSQFRSLAIGIVNLGNLLTDSPPRTTANLLICGPGVRRARLKIVEICFNLTMPQMA